MRTCRSRLTAALSLASFAAFAAVINLVPLLVKRGLDTDTAALALGLGGAGQVAGRLGYPALSKHLGVRARTALVLAMTAVTIALLELLDLPGRVDRRLDRRRHHPRTAHPGPAPGQ